MDAAKKNKKNHLEENIRVKEEKTLRKRRKMNGK